LSHPALVILLLALIQGLCEFLPVSSSGHLALAQMLLGFPAPDIVLDLTLHVGTLLAVVYFYRRSLASLFREVGLLPSALISPPRLALALKSRPDFRLGFLIIVASLPTAAIGLLFQDALSALFDSALAVGVALLITAAVLAATARLAAGTCGVLEMTLVQALIIGAVQGLAIAPGLSRSGLTIGAALILGLRRELAARFSFLLSIPAIVGGLALSLGQGLESSFALPWLLLGLAAAALCGYAALRLLTSLVERGRLALFAPWCVLVGLAAIAWWLVQG
jgi:undecaprenyl-diphosphatase